jgi:NAD+ kinase
MISTPTGSTAYNLSGNGAIIYSDLHTLQITPLAPINNKVYRCISNPIVLPEDKVIKLYPIERTKDIIILADGRKHTIKDAECVEINISKEKLKCIRLNDYDYTTIINDKYLN